MREAERKRLEREIREREAGIAIERVEMILKSGANVIFTTKGIDDLCLKHFIDKGAMAVRRCKKEDLRRIAKATGAQMVSTLADMNGDEVFENSMPLMRKLARIMLDRGIKPELEIFDKGHLANARRLIGEGLLRAPAHADLVLGVPGALEGTAANLVDANEELAARMIPDFGVGCR